MGNLNSLYISQSFQSLAHLGTNTSLVPGTMTELQDGIGQSLNISFDGTNISSSGNIYGANITAAVINTGSLVTTSSFNAYTQSNDQKVDSLISATGSYATTGSNTFFGQETFNGNLVINESGSAFGDALQITSGKLRVDTIGNYGSDLNISAGGGGVGDLNLSNVYGGNSIKLQLSGINSITGDTELTGALNITGTLTSSLQQGYVWVGDASGLTTTVATSSFGGGGGGTTYENPTLNPYSGSLILVANTFTSSSFEHISASANGQVNLVFKNNDSAGSTIISGSNNIFTNPANATAGFTRYIGGSQNYFGSTLPQLTGSAEFSPEFSNNMINTGVVMRIPVSSSPYTFRGNVLTNPAANAINLGTSAANNFEKAVSGFTMNNNILNGGIVNAVASKTPLSASITLSNNNIGGGLILNLHSSSISYNSNIVQGQLTINNEYFPNTTTANQRIVGVNGGLSVGSSTIYLSGSNTTFVGAPGRTLTNYTMLGNGNVISASLNGDLAQVNSTMLLGQALNVIGSNSRPAGPTAADWGSVFVGRWNDFSGTKGQTAETVFAVGTGRGTSTRKTGFLIDSGSNTFIEGTLNVNGSSTFTGSLNGLTLTRGPGNNNVGLGVNILQNAVSGGNVAVGNSALSSNTSGTDNIALGDNALAANISGDRNMAIGSNTLDSNTTGTLNVAIGNATLAGLIDGSANVGIGFEALKNQTTSNNNVGIGSQVLNQNISGSGNIAFGAKAGFYETGSNNFYINNTEYGSIDADRSGSLMWGTMDTTTANQTLQINATTNITQVMNLKPLDPLPSGKIGDMAVSGSSLFFYNGAWTLVI